MDIGTLYTSTGLIAYTFTFLLAATPWIEIVVVIPAGIAMGLNPSIVSFLAFTGNLATVFLLVFAQQSLHNFWKKFKTSSDGVENPSTPSGRRKRAFRLWHSYGLPGIAIMGPLVLGTHFAALIALSLGSKKYPVMLWMTFSLLLWTVIIAVVSYYGIENLKWVLG